MRRPEKGRKEKPRRFVNPNTIYDPKLNEQYDKKRTLLDNMRCTDLKAMYEERLPKEGSVRPRNVPKVNENFMSPATKSDKRLFKWTELLC